MHHWQRSQIDRLLGEILYQAEVQHKPEKHLHPVNLSSIFSDWIANSEQILLSSCKLPQFRNRKTGTQRNKAICFAVQWRSWEQHQDLLGWSVLPKLLTNIMQPSLFKCVRMTSKNYRFNLIYKHNIDMQSQRDCPWLYNIPEP